MSLLNSLLTFYTWAIVGVLLYFLFAIARFYEKKSGKRAYPYAYLICIGLFSLAAIRYIFLAPAIVGDAWADALRFVAAVLLIGFALYLLRLMLGGRA